MKILVNATSCHLGGAGQVASSFILNSLNAPNGNTYCYAVSQLVYDNLRELRPELKNQLILVTPALSRLWRGRHARKKILSLEKSFSPDVIFTVFGPAYVRFRSPHVVGFARGWITHPNAFVKSTLRLSTKIYRWAVTAKECFFLEPNAYYIEESETARVGMARNTPIPLAHISVIANTYAPPFAAGPTREAFADFEKQKEVKILILSTYYRHKNIEILPELIRELGQLLPSIRFRFLLTLPKELAPVKKIHEALCIQGNGSAWDNRGPVPLAECPALYSESDLAFIPTLLETFSAAYPEAMQMRRPVVTTDLDFAHDICREAALYYEPLSGRSAAEAIALLVRDSMRRKGLIGAGAARVRDFPSPHEKYLKQLEVLRHAAETGVNFR